MATRRDNADKEGNEKRKFLCKAAGLTTAIVVFPAARKLAGAEDEKSRAGKGLTIPKARLEPPRKKFLKKACQRHGVVVNYITI